MTDDAKCPQKVLLILLVGSGLFCPPSPDFNTLTCW